MFSSSPCSREPPGARVTSTHTATPTSIVQMKDFLADWDGLHPSREQREPWKLVRNMAIRCQEEAHLYLQFIGD